MKARFVRMAMQAIPWCFGFLIALALAVNVIKAEPPASLY